MCIFGGENIRALYKEEAGQKGVGFEELSLQALGTFLHSF